MEQLFMYSFCVNIIFLHIQHIYKIIFHFCIDRAASTERLRFLSADSFVDCVILIKQS